MPPIPQGCLPAPQPKLDRDVRSTERLAINLFELDRLPELIRQSLLLDKIDLTQPAIWVDKDKLDETAVEFSCDLLTAATICDVVRSHDRQAGDSPTRVYIFRERAWTRLPGDAVLTEVGDGKGFDVRLSWKWFPAEVRVVAARPPKRGAQR